MVMGTNLVRSAARGAVAGVVGTLGMDLLLHARYRRGGGDDGFADWELSTATHDWEHAATPGLIGRRIARDVLHRDLPDSAAAATNNVVHWATGVQWGAAYGVVAATTDRRGIRSGVALGLVACSTSYVVLPLLGLYKPIWEYDAKDLRQDYSAHVLFGALTGAAFWALTRRR